MAIKIVISNMVGFKVAGVLNDTDGKEQAFEFRLTAKRLGEDGFNAVQNDLVLAAAQTGNHDALADKLVEFVSNWSGVRDEEGVEIAYTPDLLRQLLASHRGLGLLIWRTYITETGVKEKN